MLYVYFFYKKDVPKWLIVEEGEAEMPHIYASEDRKSVLRVSYDFLTICMHDNFCNALSLIALSKKWAKCQNYRVGKMWTQWEIS